MDLLGLIAILTLPISISVVFFMDRQRHENSPHVSPYMRGKTIGIFSALLFMSMPGNTEETVRISVIYNKECRVYEQAMRESIYVLATEIKVADDARMHINAASNIANTLKNCDPDISANYSIKTLEAAERLEEIEGKPLSDLRCGRGETLIETLQKAGRFTEAGIWIGRTYHQCRKAGIGGQLYMAEMAMYYFNSTGESMAVEYYANEIIKACNASTSEECNRSKATAEAMKSIR